VRRERAVLGRLWLSKQSADCQPPSFPPRRSMQSSWRLASRHDLTVTRFTNHATHQAQQWAALLANHRQLHATQNDNKNVSCLSSLCCEVAKVAGTTEINRISVTFDSELPTRKSANAREHWSAVKPCPPFSLLMFLYFLSFFSLRFIICFDYCVSVLSIPLLR